MVEVVPIETPSLGDRSYVVTDGEAAVVIDVQRDFERALAITEARKLRITHVLETHIHNDYVTGGYRLAHGTGAVYGVAAADPVSFPRHPLADGDEIRTGGLTVSVRHTPGHTPNHLSYVVSGEDGPLAVFTGGSLLYGTVGRTDLVSGELTDRLTRQQYHSVRRLAGELPDEVAVHPTHGFGSHCAATETTATASTIGAERTANPALTTTDEDAFVRALLAGLTPYPAYYAHMAALNLAGPEPVAPVPVSPLDVEELAGRIRDGEWVIDLRSRRAFAVSHLGGVVNVELRNDLPAYVGWVIPWNAPFTLLADNPADLVEARVMLARIGYDRPRRLVTAEADRWQQHARSFPVRTFSDLEAACHAGERPVILDVRDTWEWNSGHHPAAVHIPFHELPRRDSELRGDGPVWVYCATGARAAFAASLLERSGHEVVLIDDFCLPGDVPGVRARAARAAQRQ